MGASSASYSGGSMPGLTLRAWALVSSAGALIKGFNVSAAARNSIGNYTITLTAAMADTNCLCEFKQQPAVATQAFAVSGLTTGAVSYDVQQGGANIDKMSYVAVYG